MGWNSPLPAAELGSSGAILAELAAANTRLEDLVTLLGGEYVSQPRRITIDAAHPWRDSVFDTDDAWHSVLVNNPNAVALLAGFGAGTAQPGMATDVIPAQMAVVLTQPFSAFSVGIDPAAMPGTATTVYLRFYARPMPPNGWRLS